MGMYLMGFSFHFLSFSLLFPFLSFLFFFFVINRKGCQEQLGD